MIMIIVSILVVSVLASLANGTCPNGFNAFENSCYAYIDHKMTWFDAASTCAALGGYLVEVYTNAENDYIKSLAQGHTLWMGGEDLLKEGDWTWARSRLSMEFTDWAPDQPKTDLTGTNPHNCLEMNVVTSGGSWNDEECEDQHRFVCQRLPVTIVVG